MTEQGKKLEGHGSCFICGDENPKGLGLAFYLMEDGRVESRFSLNLAQQGPPGHAHGGSLAAILDEVMGAAVWRAGHPVLLAHIELDYHRPVPLEQDLCAVGWVDKAHGRQVHASGELRLADGTVATKSKGLFIHAPQFFKKTQFWQG